jgi:hypothetical protein
MTDRRSLVAVLAGALALCGATAACAPTQAGATVGSDVVMYGESGAFVESGVDVFTGDQIQLDLQAPMSVIELNVGSPLRPAAHFFSFAFSAPPTDLLAPGEYDEAQQQVSTQPGHAGIDIDGDGHGCNVETGRFDVKDLGLSDTGRVTRLWILYEQHCEGAAAALWGEIRYHEPLPRGPLRPVPVALRWPARAFGHRGDTVPITFTAARAVVPGRAEITGSGRRSFTVDADDCRGRALAAGRSCRVFVTFLPRLHGSSHARLSVAGAAPGASVELAGSTSSKLGKAVFA